VSKAYDTVWWIGLHAALSKLHIEGRFLSVLRTISSTISRQVVVGDEVSEPFSLHRGVAQGAVLSPLLYAIFIDSLLRELESSPFGVRIAGVKVPVLAFADDLTLTASSPEHLNELLSLVHKHAMQWRFHINVSKSAAAVVGTPAQEARAATLKFCVGEQQLRLDPDYPYLGVPFSALRGRTHSYVEQHVSAARAKQPLLSGAGGVRYGGIQPPLGLSVWNATVRPGLEWAAEVVSLSATALKRLDSVLPAFLRAAAGMDSFTPNDALMAEFGAQSSSSRFMELQARYFKHLATADPERLVSKIFRLRCAQAKIGNAKRSLCWSLRDLLSKLGLSEAWQSLPRSRTDPCWHQWASRVHSACIKHDLEQRARAISDRPSLGLFKTLKPLSRQSVPAYLWRRGLGPWIKLKARVDALPVLASLGRHCSPPLAGGEILCGLCHEGAESVEHFLTRCSALEGARLSFLDLLRSDPVFCELPGASSLIHDWSRGTTRVRLRLLLSSVELEPKKPRDRDREQRSSRVTGDAAVTAESRFEVLSLSYLESVWRLRASLLGGVPSIGVHGRGLVLSRLLDDGRSRVFGRGTAI
jgi:hypothetical protein